MTSHIGWQMNDRVSQDWLPHDPIDGLRAGLRTASLPVYIILYLRRLVFLLHIGIANLDGCI